MRATRSGVLTVLLFLLLSLAGCSSTTQLESIQSQLSDIQRQILQVQRQVPGKEDLSGLETVISDEMAKLLKSDADTQVELDRLSAQIEQLKARLEDSTASLSQLSQRIAATNQELKTLRNAPRFVPEGEGPVPPTNVDPEQLYQTAYNDYLRGNYDLAILGFRQYIESFPDTESADNALYWIGECYFGQGKYRQAIKAFSDVQGRYPDSDRLPSALLKKGYAYLELGENGQGIVQLRAVIRDYPNSDIAVLARQHLEQLGVDAN